MPLTILQNPHIQYSPIGNSIASQFESSAISGHAMVSFHSYTCHRTENKQTKKQKKWSNMWRKKLYTAIVKHCTILGVPWSASPAEWIVETKQDKFQSFDRRYGQIASWWFPLPWEPHCQENWLKLWLQFPLLLVCVHPTPFLAKKDKMQITRQI